MRGLAEEVWRDLRDRKLWPVALGLVVAVALVPLLLLEPAAAPAPDAAGIGAGAPAPAAPAVAVESPAVLVAEGSDLDVFTPRDPFARPQRRRARRPSSGSGTRRAGSSSPASSASPGASPSTLVPPTSSPPSAPSGSDSTLPSADRPVGDQSSRYTDVVDIRFGRRGEERTRSHVVRMTALPGDGAVLTFLGPSVSGRSAVFLLAPDLAKQAGDGTCEPSPGDCRMISLRTDREHDQHFLTDAQGTKYSIRLLSIDRIPVADALELERRTDTRQ